MKKLIEEKIFFILSSILSLSFVNYMIIRYLNKPPFIKALIIADIIIVVLSIIEFKFIDKKYKKVEREGE